MRSPLPYILCVLALLMIALPIFAMAGYLVTLSVAGIWTADWQEPSP